MQDLEDFSWNTRSERALMLPFDFYLIEITREKLHQKKIRDWRRIFIENLLSFLFHSFQGFVDLCEVHKMTTLFFLSFLSFLPLKQYRVLEANKVFFITFDFSQCLIRSISILK